MTVICLKFSLLSKAPVQSSTLVTILEVAMQVSNDSAAVNYVDYFTKQFPIDLANMAALRDELAVRQGALSAAQDAVADRERAKQELDAAKAEAVALKVDATADREAAKQELADAKAKAKDLNAQAKAALAAAVERETAVELREKVVADLEDYQTEAQAEIESQQADLKAKTAALDARVKAFQDKVAALTA
jgi:chromosome segregation ATPase